MNEKEELERRLSEMLTEGALEQNGREERQRRQISPKYEIRIQTTLDPIVEETLRYRKIGRELDDRYDRYLERAGKGNSGQGPELRRNTPVEKPDNGNR